MTALNPLMRIGHQIAEARRARLGYSKKAAQVRAVELLRQVGVPDPERRAQAYPHQLSGGLRQRVVIPLSCEPRLLLCDDPTTALDVTIQATHDLAVVTETCDRLAVMYAGRLVEEGRIAGLMEEPRHACTYSLLRSLPDPDVVRQRLLTITGAPPDLVRAVTGCPFSPRCPFATADCVGVEPTLGAVGPGRTSACRHADQASQWPHTEQVSA